MTMKAVRRGGTFAVWGVVALCVSLVGGCSGSSAPAAGSRGVRGTELPSFSCDAKADGAALKISPAAVLELLVCPVVAPSPFNRPSKPIELVRGSAGFEGLLTALSLPDEPRDKTKVCPAIAELLPRVLVKTASSAVLVHLPDDSCGQSLPAVRQALSRLPSPT